MIERLGLILLLVLLTAIVVWVWREAHGRRVAGQLTPTGRPRLLYFRGDSCGGCATQARVLAQVAPPFADRVQIEQIDAERERETAARFAVFTLPTTLLIDERGRVRHINYGLTPAGKLTRQLEEIT